MTAVELINEARASGCRLKPACEELNITSRTYQRWTKDGEVKKDQRPLVKIPTPKNKLSEEERKEIIEVVNSPEYADLAPSQIVPKLADKGKYIASESTIYKVLKEEKMNTHRSRTSIPVKREPPTPVATAANQVWTWDYPDKKVIPTFIKSWTYCYSVCIKVGITYCIILVDILC